MHKKKKTRASTSQEMWCNNKANILEEKKKEKKNKNNGNKINLKALHSKGNHFKK